MRVGVLVDEELIVGRPVRFDVRARAGCDVGYSRVRRIVADVGDADAAIAEVVGFVGVESNARAAMRPGGPPGVERAYCVLHWRAATSGHDVELIRTDVLAGER